MQLVRFLKNFDCYNSGEIAGFPPDRAAELVASGVAQFYVPNVAGSSKPKKGKE